METITITRSQYDELVADQRMLDHLRAMGVDNWEGYSTPAFDDDDDDYNEEDD